MTGPLAAIARVAPAVIRRPHLWPTAIGQMWRLRRRRWWRRPPFLPVPDSDYWRFRMITQYGGDGTGPASADDVVAYLEWVRSWPRVCGA